MKKYFRQPGRIYTRIRKIIEIARGNIAHAVNTEMVVAYWHIGKEIVEAEQRGISRAGYGKKLIENLSQQLIENYGTGWSTSHLWHVRQFYLLYKDRMPANLRTRGADLKGKILHTLRAELSWNHYRTLPAEEIGAVPAS